MISLAFFASLAGCGMAMDRSAGEADGDSGSDVDVDVDVDVDSDIDGDSDLDLESRDVAGSCDDGADNDLDGLVDCFALGCREDAACCGDLVGVASESFDVPLGGTWTPFGAPQVSTGSLFFPGAAHESGVTLAERLDPHGLVEVTATVDLPAACDGCAAYGGVALTTQTAVGDESGIRPVAAIVLSAMDGAVHGVVDGEAVYDSDAVTAPVTLGLRLLADGSVDLEWTDAAAAGAETVVGPATRPDTDLTAAVYGRSDMRVDDVAIGRAGCIGPAGGVRRGAVLSPAGWSAGGVRSPSVVASDGRWLLYYDGAGGIGRAESLDGLAWLPTPANAILEGPYAAPGVVDVDPGAADGRALFVETWDDPSAHRIVSMRSREADGLGFGDPIVAVQPDDTIASARDPHPMLADGSVFLFFTAVDTDGKGAIGATRSDDGGASWSAPAIVLPAGADDADGLYAPSVIAGPRGWEMWLEVRDGLSSRIEYAVSSDGETWQRSDDLAARTVLSPGDGFDGRAASDPFVVDDALTGTERLYYAGASDTAYSIGLVERYLP